MKEIEKFKDFVVNGKYAYQGVDYHLLLYDINQNLQRLKEQLERLDTVDEITDHLMDDIIKGKFIGDPKIDLMKLQKSLHIVNGFSV
jgi:hypothetical protein